MIDIVDWHGKKKIRVALGADHGGFEMKKKLIEALVKKGVDAVDAGAHELDPKDDYPQFGAAVAKMVAHGKVSCGVLVCRSGVGMGIAANRLQGVRAAVAGDPRTASLSREHNCSNVLVLPGDVLSDKKAFEVVEAWLDTPFSKEKRHKRRLVCIERLTRDEISSLRCVDSELAAMIDRSADGSRGRPGPGAVVSIASLPSIRYPEYRF